MVMESEHPPQCRICLGTKGKLYSRCSCGESSWFHNRCLVQWIRQSSMQCEICGKVYTGVTNNQSVWRFSPDMMMDIGANTVVIFGLWWYQYCGVMGAFVLSWWASCWAVDRSARMQRDQVGYRMWTVRSHRYQLEPV